jgi:hypothetical protein
LDEGMDRMMYKIYGKLSWDGVVELIRRAHYSQDTNLTQREIDLAYGAKDRHASITHNFLVFFQYCMCCVFVLKILTR